MAGISILNIPRGTTVTKSSAQRQGLQQESQYLLDHGRLTAPFTDGPKYAGAVSSCVSHSKTITLLSTRAEEMGMSCDIDRAVSKSAVNSEPPCRVQGPSRGRSVDLAGQIEFHLGSFRGHQEFSYKQDRRRRCPSYGDGGGPGDG